MGSIVIVIISNELVPVSRTGTFSGTPGFGSYYILFTLSPLIYSNLFSKVDRLKRSPQNDEEFCQPFFLS